LMTFLLPGDDDNDQEKQEIGNLVEKLNLYLSDKQTDNLPIPERFRNKVKNQVKVFVIHLFRNKQYELLDLLDLPSYIEPYIEPAFKLVENDLEASKENIFKNWIDYLDKSGNNFLISTVTLSNENFWGSTKMDHASVFDKHFSVFEREINDQKNVYQVFSHLRRTYLNLYKKVQIQKLLQIFDISENEYDKAKQNFVHEFSQLLTTDDPNLIEEIFYEK